MGIELMIEDYSWNKRMINNYQSFHELNTAALKGIYNLDQDVLKSLNEGVKPIGLDFSDQYQGIHDSIISMIAIADHPNFDSEKKYQSDRFVFNFQNYSEMLEKLDGKFKPVLEQIKMNCQMGYNLRDSRVKEVHNEFRAILSGRSKVDPSKVDTFEELVRNVHNHFYDNFNNMLLRRKPIPSIFGFGRSTVVYFAVDGETINPKMQKVVDAVNSVDDFNTGFHNYGEERWDIEGTNKSAIVKNVIGGLFTDASASIVMAPSRSSDDKIDMQIFYDDSKERYRISWHLGTKGHISQRKSDLISKVFKGNGWSYNKDYWSEKDVEGRIDVSEGDLVGAIIPVVMLNDYACFKKPYQEIETGKKMLKKITLFRDAYFESQFTQQ
ncbi:hypothetical protein HOA92_03935 [archaeon]|jgi:hypothetical protein|nr:hypothetical protein [archaeon]MBT6762163.1 hypothetical protein [archaeon]